MAMEPPGYIIFGNSWYPRFQDKMRVAMGPQDSGCRQLKHILLGIQHRHCCWCPGGHYGGREWFLTSETTKGCKMCMNTGSGRICFGTWAGEIRGFDSSLENNLHVLQGEHSGCILWSFMPSYPRQLRLFHLVWRRSSKSQVSVVSNLQKTMQCWAICCGVCLWNLKIGWFRTDKRNESNIDSQRRNIPIVGRQHLSCWVHCFLLCIYIYPIIPPKSIATTIIRTATSPFPHGARTYTSRTWPWRNWSARRSWALPWEPCADRRRMATGWPWGSGSIGRGVPQQFMMGKSEDKMGDLGCTLILG